MLLLFSIERMAAHPVFQSLRLMTGSTLTPALIRPLSAMLHKIVVSNFPDDCYLPSKPRKLYGGVCCRAAARTYTALGAILLVFVGPSGGSKN
jgi:hypothetical protein